MTTKGPIQFATSFPPWTRALVIAEITKTYKLINTNTFKQSALNIYRTHTPRPPFPHNTYILLPFHDPSLKPYFNTWPFLFPFLFLTLFSLITFFFNFQFCKFSFFKSDLFWFLLCKGLNILLISGESPSSFSSSSSLVSPASRHTFPFSSSFIFILSASTNSAFFFIQNLVKIVGNNSIFQRRTQKSK